VIDAADDYSFEFVFVRNVGCGAGADPRESCFYVSTPSTRVSLASGGYVGFSIEVYDSSLLTIAGGSTDGLVSAGDGAIIAMSGGSIHFSLYAEDGSTVLVFGGHVGGTYFAWDTSTLGIYGHDFELDGVPVPYGNLTATSGTLTGVLQSGELLDNPIQRDPTARLILILPEPMPSLGGAGAFAALAMAARQARRPLGGTRRRSSSR
jgi:hypothetical protein